MKLNCFYSFVWKSCNISKEHDHDTCEYIMTK